MASAKYPPQYVELISLSICSRCFIREPRVGYWVTYDVIRRTQSVQYDVTRHGVTSSGTFSVRMTLHLTSSITSRRRDIKRSVQIAGGIHTSPWSGVESKYRCDVRHDESVTTRTAGPVRGPARVTTSRRLRCRCRMTFSVASRSGRQAALSTVGQSATTTDSYDDCKS